MWTGRSDDNLFGASIFTSFRSPGEAATEITSMAKRFKTDNHVIWNSEAGHVSGKIIKVRTQDVDYKEHIHRYGNVADLPKTRVSPAAHLN